MRNIWQKVVFLCTDLHTTDTNRCRTILMSTTSSRGWKVQITSQSFLLNNKSSNWLNCLLQFEYNGENKQLVIIKIGQRVTILSVTFLNYVYINCIDNIDVSSFEKLILTESVWNKLNFATTCTNESYYLLAWQKVHFSIYILKLHYGKIRSVLSHGKVLSITIHLLIPNSFLCIQFLAPNILYRIFSTNYSIFF